MPKRSLTVDQAVDLREDGYLFDGSTGYATALDTTDGPDTYRTWIVRCDELSGEKTFWRTLYKVMEVDGELVNSLLDGPDIVFERVPAMPVIGGEGYVVFHDGAVSKVGGKGASPQA